MRSFALGLSSIVRSSDERNRPQAHNPLRRACRSWRQAVPFAGYEMPVQYPTGILTEHNWTRTSAGLFDVSHMGQAFLVGPDHATTAAAMEKLVPADIASLKPHQIRYSQFLNPEGGILDDLMITRSAGMRAVSISSATPRARTTTLPISKKIFPPM